MRLVRGPDDRPYVVRARAPEERTVLDPATGEERTFLAADADPIVDESELQVAVETLPRPTEPPLATIGDARGLGLLVILDAAGPLPATTLLAFEDLCESDLNGIVSELRAAGLVESAQVDGRQGYRTTDLATESLWSLRS